MLTSLSDHPIDIRALNIYDNSQWKTPEKSYSNYKKLCEAFGTQSVSYEDYEDWFNIHSKEAYYSKNRKRDLPILDIRGCILSDVINKKSAQKSLNDLYEAFEGSKIDKEDHDYCLNLRNVSYGLRTIIDQKAPAFTEFYVFCEDHIMQFDAGNAFLVSQNAIYSRFSIELVEKGVLKMLKFLLNHTKLRLKFLSFEAVFSEYEMVPVYKNLFVNLLKSLDHKIQVKSCSIGVQNEEDVFEILQFLKPGTLESLKLTNYGWNGSYDINRIVSMDQWKQAKHLRIIGFNLPSVEHFFISQLSKRLMEHFQ